MVVRSLALALLLVGRVAKESREVSRDQLATSGTRYLDAKGDTTRLLGRQRSPRGASGAQEVPVETALTVPTLPTKADGEQ